MVNLTAAERVYEYWIDKASSAADLVLKIVFAVTLFLVARKLILWVCHPIRKNMRRLAGIIRWNPMTACLQAPGRR